MMPRRLLAQLQGDPWFLSGGTSLKLKSNVQKVEAGQVY